MTENGNLLIVDNLKTWFPIRKGFLRRVTGQVKAVDGVSFSIPRGKTLGLVGESGCGKTTVGRSILRLIPATAGKVLFDGQDVFETPAGQMRNLRKHMQLIFQDPFGSLNPRMTVGNIIGEACRVHGIAKGNECRQLVSQLLEKVGLSPNHINRYPHEFSGGQRQRIGIARALALKPSLIICDEPVSALDVSIQSQIVNLLMDLQKEFQLTYLFIAHDLAVVKHISDHVAVMYLGKIVEIAPVEKLFDDPLHPYTKALLRAVPVEHPRDRHKRVLIKGQVPSSRNLPPGCHFCPRCPDAMTICRDVAPERIVVGAGHEVSC
ncbi:MAG: ABC transporter ATP-binding protein, partial [Planctomycetes bacterium]|nr:ABC transporter ATP-binding protein [Planctomycetota bacterium]